MTATFDDELTRVRAHRDIEHLIRLSRARMRLHQKRAAVDNALAFSDHAAQDRRSAEVCQDPDATSTSKGAKI